MASSLSSAGEPPHDMSKRVWHDGKVMQVYVQIPQKAGGHGNNAPSDDLPDTDVYLIGSIDEADSFGPERVMPAVDPVTGEPMTDASGQPLEEVTIPAHDDTFAQYYPDGTIADTFGYWVLPGSAASESNLRTREQPMNSLAQAPLAYAVDLGDGWQPLTRATLVQQALERDIIALKFSNWGGGAWLAPLPAREDSK